MLFKVIRNTGNFVCITSKTLNYILQHLHYTLFKDVGKKVLYLMPLDNCLAFLLSHQHQENIHISL